MLTLPRHGSPLGANAIAQNHSTLSNLKVNYTLASAESFAQREQRYDIVFNMEVVEHVAALDTFMDICCQLVRPGGLIFVATINRSLPTLILPLPTKEVPGTSSSVWQKSMVRLNERTLSGQPLSTWRC